MRQEEKKALVFELVDTLLQSWWTIVAGVCLGLAGALVALQLITSVYMADATILIIPQKIPENLVRSTVTQDMTQRMIALKESVLSESYMRELVDRVYGLPKSEERLDRMIRSVRGRITLTPTVADQFEMLAFELAFKDDDAERTALVANTLAELYVEQNTQFRANQARDTAKTLEERAAQARSELETAEQDLARFNAQHSFETEAHLEANLSLRESRARDLETVRTRQRAVQQELDDHRRRLDQTTTGAASSALALADARRELANLLRSYSPAHPDVKQKQREIDELLEAGADEVPPDELEAAEMSASPEAVALRGRITEAERELQDLEGTETRLRGEIAEYERRINAVPRIQPRLTRLENARELARGRYETAQKKADSAGESRFLEESLRGEHFELAKRAEVPRLPVFPQPVRFYALGIIAGVMLFVGPLLARRFLNPMVCSEAGLRALTDVPILVSIPRIQTPRTRGYATQRFFKNLAFSTVCTAVLVVTIVVLQQFGG